jgi:TldD protein
MKLSLETSEHAIEVIQKWTVAHTVDELFEKVDSGLYVKGTRGGQVDTSKGTFQFSAEESYMIEKGKLTTPLLDVSLSGMTLETLNN